MNEIEKYLALIFTHQIEKVVLSKNRDTESKYKKVTLSKEVDFWQVERLTSQQAFHERVIQKDLIPFCMRYLETGFMQLNAFDNQSEYIILISKKGKIHFNKTKCTQPIKIQSGHNREKQYPLNEGEIVLPLIDMGIFTKEGKVVATMHDKFRQINKFVEIIDEAIKKAKLKSIRIVDFGCGKSYLTFILYYYLHEKKQLDVHITGLDLKADVIEKCNLTAKKYNYTNLHFQVGDIEGYERSMPVDMVISLHACDTATDFALYHAICWNAPVIISVPCCQHELAGQLDSETFHIIERYGIIKERMAALMTDAIRGNLLEASGYKTQILEFVDLSHTPKNLLIRAIKTNVTKEHKKKMMDEVERLTEECKLHPKLYELLCQHDAKSNS